MHLLEPWKEVIYTSVQGLPTTRRCSDQTAKTVDVERSARKVVLEVEFEEILDIRIGSRRGVQPVVAICASGCAVCDAHIEAGCWVRLLAGRDGDGEG